MIQNQYINLANNINREDNLQSRDNLSKLKKFISSSIKCKADSLESKEGDN